VNTRVTPNPFPPDAIVRNRDKHERNARQRRGSIPFNPTCFWEFPGGWPVRFRPAKRLWRVSQCILIGPGIDTGKPVNTRPQNKAFGFTRQQLLWVAALKCKCFALRKAEFRSKSAGSSFDLGLHCSFGLECWVTYGPNLFLLGCFFRGIVNPLSFIIMREKKSTMWMARTHGVLLPELWPRGCQCVQWFVASTNLSSLWCSKL
jgi:hypothetical protein